MRMGRDVLEVAVPVASEEGDALGTIRYGLSTDRMHEALAHAKRDSDGRLWRSVLMMVVLVGGVTAVGLALSRAQAVRITEPIGALRRAAETLASGDRSVRVDIQSGDELALLGMSFNRMVDELDSSYGQLELMNRTLEQKVEVRTAELAHKNRDMRLVLDNVDQGLISLTANGVVVGERSAAADRMVWRLRSSATFLGVHGAVFSAVCSCFSRRLVAGRGSLPAARAGSVPAARAADSRSAAPGAYATWPCPMTAAGRLGRHSDRDRRRDRASGSRT